MALRSLGKVADTPFLRLTQVEMGGGRHLGSQDPADPKGGRASSSPGPVEVIVPAMSSQADPRVPNSGTSPWRRTGAGEVRAHLPLYGKQGCRALLSNPVVQASDAAMISS